MGVQAPTDDNAPVAAKKGPADFEGERDGR